MSELPLSKENAIYSHKYGLSHKYIISISDINFKLTFMIAIFIPR
ncbi:hypothetical protein Xmau_02773 [Xenorhabdus mauleonii]|uniref:Uncharacterized protein n=1 Tax=Xenorhabdus mauleonii TaxID=351675 RepID=A0A1I3IBQ9_9GAMM|nr:hypothetical protein Xmau_02773 [Xenorhabdus mauleonii]SFI45280.1 hypothetical protein SAMN05421680_101271 [Xenorhabdus mauleonii]